MKMKFPLEIDIFSKFLTLAFKIFVLIGGLCFSIYCLKLGYFPTGLTMGDAVLLIFLGVSFGIIYFLFLVSILSFGLFFTPFFKFLQWFFVKCGLVNKNKKMLKLIFPDFSGVGFGFVGLLLIWIFYKIEPTAAITLPLTAAFIGIVFAKYCEISEKINKAILEENSVVKPYESNIKNLPFNKRNHLIQKYFCLMTVVVFPLIVGGVSGILLEGSMAFANVKKGKSYVMLRAPYSSVVPSELKSSDGPKSEGYVTFENINVLFSGLGYKTVIEFHQNNKNIKFEVPNENIIIIPKV